MTISKSSAFLKSNSLSFKNDNWKQVRRMTKKKAVKTIRLDDQLDARVKAYAESLGITEADALRDLLEKGLACESLSVFATPVGQLIRDVVEAEFSLLRDEMDARSEAAEERLARITARGTKAGLQTAMQLNDLSRALVPAWRETSAKELWDSYSHAGGELQAGIPFNQVREGMR